MLCGNQIENQFVSEGASVRAKRADVTAVIVTYGERSNKCAAAIRAAFEAGVGRVLLVANGISDSEFLSLGVLLGNNLKPIICCRVDSNTGSAGGFHLGIRSALRHGAKLVWLLDDDNIATPDALTMLLDAKSNIEHKLMERVAVTCFRPDDGVQLRTVSRGCDANPPDGSFLSFDLYTMFMSTRRSKSTPSLDVIQIGLAPYGGLLLDRSVVVSIGLPETAMLLYEDDTEYTDRLKSIGVKLFLVPWSVVNDNDSKWSQSQGKARRLGAMDSSDLVRLWFATRNRAYFDRKRCENWTTLARFHCNRLIFLSTAFVVGVRRRQYQQFFVLRHGVLHGRKAKSASELASIGVHQRLLGQPRPIPLDQSAHREQVIGSK